MKAWGDPEPGPRFGIFGGFMLFLACAAYVLAIAEVAVRYAP